MGQMPRSIERTVFLVSSRNGRHSDRWAFIMATLHLRRCALYGLVQGPQLYCTVDK